MNYKRKGHRGRHKRRGITYNNNLRIAGNSVGKASYYGNGRKAHISASERNRILVEELT